MILPAQNIRALCVPPIWTGPPMIEPFHERAVEDGMTFGLSAAGYDVRLDQDIVLGPGDFVLASTIERFALPDDILMEVADKSSLARLGLRVGNTRAEPGWRGYLTLEITNHGREVVVLHRGAPIAQAVFQRLEAPTDQPYRGRYQDQERGPQAVRFAKPGDMA